MAATVNNFSKIEDFVVEDTLQDISIIFQLSPSNFCKQVNIPNISDEFVIGLILSTRMVLYILHNHLLF